MNEPTLKERIKVVCYDMEQLQEDVRHVNAQMEFVAEQLNQLRRLLNTRSAQIPNVEGAIPCPLCDGVDGGCLYCGGNGWILSEWGTIDATVREAIDKFRERTGLKSPSMCMDCLGRGYITNRDEDGIDCCAHCNGTGRVEDNEK